MNVRPNGFLVLAMLLLAAGCMDRGVPTAPPEAALLSGGGCTLGVPDADAIAIIDALVPQVDALGSAGALNGGQARALRNHLENARRHVQGRRYCPARAQLEAFRQQVEHFRRNGLLTDRQMAPLLQPLRILMPAAPRSGDIPEMYAPGVVGELRTLQHDGQEITYEVIDGLAIFQSDMIFGYADEFEASSAGAGAARAGGEVTPMSGVCNLFHTICDRWTDGIVGYDFANNWGDEATNAMMRARIEDAITHWRLRTGMQFQRRSGGERLVFRNAGGCSSWVGRQVVTFFDPQWISLSTMCDFGRIVHEIGHAIGLHHEHNRSDRGSFVRVNLDLVQLEQWHNFFPYLFLGRDLGSYDYGSIMHYECTAFRREGATGNTVEPVIDGFTCADIGQRVSLSEGDILGAYTLYPPVYTISGATPGETRDRFDLTTLFTRHPVRNPDHIVWTTNRVPGVLATGPNLSIRTPELPTGTHVITASVVILGTTVAQQSITLNLVNNPPAVSLGPNRNVDLGRRVFVTATVTDVEDGECLSAACTYTWDPAPEQQSGHIAVYRFPGIGPQTVSVTVRDGGGATASASVMLTAVNSPPVPVINVPAPGSSFSSGSSILVDGYATDLNLGPDPGPGFVDCVALRWSSDNPTDSFSPINGCNPRLAFGSPGTRILTLGASDPQGASASTSLQVTVGDCGANCPPDVSFVINTPPQLDGSRFSPPFTGPGYYLSTPIQMTGTINDADVPPDNPVEFEWRLTPPCFDPTGSSCPPYLVLSQGSLTVPAGPGAAMTNLTWTPRDDVAEWSGCVTTALPFTIRLWTRDSRGATNIFSRTIYLACQLV